MSPSMAKTIWPSWGKHVGTIDKTMTEHDKKLEQLLEERKAQDERVANALEVAE